MQKYIIGNSDGSILRPYTTISSVLNQYVEPEDNTDTHFMDRFIVYINGGNYDEDLVMCGSRHWTLIACGLIVLGTGNSQYFATSTTPRNITIRMGRNVAQSTSYYRETAILETLIKTQHGCP